LCRYFYKLRSDILKGISPMVLYQMYASGPGVPTAGTVIIENRPAPTLHRGQSITDSSTHKACELYVAYLEEMLTSAAGVVNAAQDRFAESFARSMTRPPSSPT